MERRHDLDWVRILAFGLLVLYHVGMYYVTWDWHVKSPQAGTAIEPLMFLSSPWRLSLLFLVSGAATGFLLARPEGTRRFLRERSWRLLVPLVFGMLVVVPPQSYFEVVEKLPGGFHDGYLAFWGRYLAGDGGFCRDGECLDLPTWNHLWFVAYLWVYTLVLWALLRFTPSASATADRLLARAVTGWGLLLWPAVFLVGARMLLVARFESTHALVDDWYNHAQYLPLFLLGFLLARREAAWERIEALRWPALAVAACGYAYVAWYFHSYAEVAASDAVRLAQRVAWGINQWAMIVAILGFARRYAPGDSPARRYLTDAVFPVYILHQTIIVVVSRALRPLDLHPALEGPLLVALTFALAFAGYEVIRRIALLRPLFGLKRWRRPAPAPLPDAPRSAG